MWTSQVVDGESDRRARCSRTGITSSSGGCGASINPLARLMQIDVNALDPAVLLSPLPEMTPMASASTASGVPVVPQGHTQQRMHLYEVAAQQASSASSTLPPLHVLALGFARAEGRIVAAAVAAIIADVD